MTEFTPPITPLFVPATQPDRFSKAATSGADAIIIDLEDSVAGKDKATARGNINKTAVAELAKLPAAVFVRINGEDTEFFADDLAHVAPLMESLAGLVLPKIETTSALTSIAHHCGETCAVIGLVESAKGIVNLPQLCQAANIAQLGFGAIDYALDVASNESNEALLFARSKLVTLSRAFGLHPPLDKVTADFTDAKKVATHAGYAASLGFGGKLLIHPKQVAPTQQAFLPTASEVTWAERVLACVAETNDGVANLDGEMIDRPVIAKAHRIINRAGK